MYFVLICLTLFNRQHTQNISAFHSFQVLTRVWKFVNQHGVHCHYVWPCEALNVFEDLQGRKHQKKYQKRERQERRFLRGCIFLFLFTSGRVQYLKSSSSSWKSCTLLTTFSDWPYSDFRAVFFIIIAPGRLTSFLQILMNSFLQSRRQRRQSAL